MKLLLSTLSGIIGALSFVAFCTLILGFKLRSLLHPHPRVRPPLLAPVRHAPRLEPSPMTTLRYKLELDPEDVFKRPAQFALALVQERLPEERFKIRYNWGPHWRADGSWAIEGFDVLHRVGWLAWRALDLEAMGLQLIAEQRASL